jgi:hypothetical protein
LGEKLRQAGGELVAEIWERRMKLDKPTIIGFKYVGGGLMAFIICVLIISKLIAYSGACAVGAGVAVMSAMVMGAAKEAYSASRQTARSASNISPK